MKLKGNSSMSDFLERIAECAHDVYFETKEGDRLNLKSTLSKFIFTTSLENADYFTDGKVICEDVNDYSILSDYLEKDT